MLHNLPPLPPIKGGEGEESKFPRAASASKYIQATHEDGNYAKLSIPLYNTILIDEKIVGEPLIDFDFI